MNELDMNTRMISNFYRGMLTFALLAFALAARAASPGENNTMAQQSKNSAPIDATLAASLGGEPTCRVGIVLEEDNKPRMEIVLPAGKFILTVDGRETPISTREPIPLTIAVADGTIVLTRSSDGQRLGSSPGHMRLVRADQPARLEPKDGVLFKSCVTGRGFHWQKEVDFTFPYHFEFHHRNGKLIVVNELPMEPYLTCVVTSEMSKDCPPEFVKAQATAARAWMQVFLKNKHRNEPFTICNDDDCQRYQGTTWLSQEVADAVAACSGMYLVDPDGSICPAYYSKSCGGIMEKGTNVFGAGAESLSADCDAPANSPTERFNPVSEATIREWVEGGWVGKSDSYCSPNVVPETTLKTFIGAVDDAGQYYRWKVTYSREELEGMLRKKAGIGNMAEFVDFKPGARGNSGRLMSLDIVYRDDAGTTQTHTIRKEYNIRKALHEKFLFSGAFFWDFARRADGRINTVTLTGAGWGHGAGLCQIGALGMAIKGIRYEDILKHYFGGAELKRAY